MGGWRLSRASGTGDRPRSVHSSLEGFDALARLDPAQYVRDVRTEVAKVTWPSRKETLITTGLVLAMSALAAVFFLVVDQVIALGMRSLFGMG